MKRLKETLKINVKYLFIFYLCWKLIILVVVASSPGPGYDTSSDLFETGHRKQAPILIRNLIQKLTRWDAIYFVNISRRGYVFEQEWAFGWGMAKLMALCTAGLEKIFNFEGIESLVGILIAHISHLLSVVTLFYLTLDIFPEETPNFALSSACLHIISPAGIFLSTPCAESSCAFLNFAGYLVFVKSRLAVGSLKKDTLILISGTIFGIATTFRNNSILNGFLLLEEIFRTLLSLHQGFQFATLRHLFATGIAGLIVAAGTLIPQYIAYREYCQENLTLQRPWCTKTFPSIYSFVQSHYWDVGLFRYWKLSNLPLFLLAAPMFFLMISSAVWVICPASQGLKSCMSGGEFYEKNENYWVLRNMAISQLLLAFIILTTAHVQIITRISSSHPVWMWASVFLLRRRKGWLHKYLVRYMVIYGIVQAGLYSSFLPPA